MKIKEIEIPIYSYKLYYIEVEKYESKALKEIEKLFNKINLDCLDDVKTHFENKDIGCATTYHRPGDLTIVIIIYPSESNSRRLECICHEKRHAEDDIANRLGIENDNEAVAYLAGYLATVLPIVK